MATVTLDQAARAVEAEARKRNFKIVEQVPKIIADIGEQQAVYIFNVGPKPWSRNLGSLGTFFVPACPKDARVSEPLKIKGVVLERIATDMDKMANRYEEGIDIANDVMYIGRGYTPDLNREKWGLFISDVPKPSDARISAAKAELRKTYARLVDEADLLERNNKRDQIGDTHRDAASALGVNKSWLVQEPREADSCPACGKRIDISAVKCPECSAILDLEGVKKFFPQDYLAYIAANKDGK